MGNEAELLPDGVASVGRWMDAEFYLPRSNHLPVQVDEGGGERRFIATVAGDWRLVKRWRSVTPAKGFPIKATPSAAELKEMG